VLLISGMVLISMKPSILCPCTAVLVSVMSVGAPPSADSVPFVYLTATSSAATHYRDGSWSIAVMRPAGWRGNLSPQAVGLCRGTFINPEIVARGSGTAVHFATKYFCSAPVAFTITTGVNSWYEESPTGSVTSHPGGSATGGGISPNPYVEGFSPPCKNNQNSGWQPWERAKLNDGEASNSGTRITVGCRV